MKGGGGEFHLNPYVHPYSYPYPLHAIFNNLSEAFDDHLGSCPYAISQLPVHLLPPPLLTHGHFDDLMLS